MKQTIKTFYVNAGYFRRFRDPIRVPRISNRVRRIRDHYHRIPKVCTFHDGCKQGIDQQIFNRKSISRKITHPQSWKLQAKLAGEKLKAEVTAEKKQTQDYNKNFVIQAHK